MASSTTAGTAPSTSTTAVPSWTWSRWGSATSVRCVTTSRTPRSTRPPWRRIPGRGYARYTVRRACRPGGSRTARGPSRSTSRTRRCRSRRDASGCGARTRRPSSWILSTPPRTACPTMRGRCAAISTSPRSRTPRWCAWPTRFACRCSCSTWVSWPPCGTAPTGNPPGHCARNSCSVSRGWPPSGCTARSSCPAESKVRCARSSCIPC